MTLTSALALNDITSETEKKTPETNNVVVENEVSWPSRLTKEFKFKSVLDRKINSANPLSWYAGLDRHQRTTQKRQGPTLECRHGIRLRKGRVREAGRRRRRRENDD
ncbi:hypothetical protein GWI33_005184 [Rhynchophorus ferrugineus]|uniref:Uncharacterized protein n=1 Tax=Rhynchophorus ferrugineus TaxID=354439 RepID=A0A834IM11_RHYFE|nr:hypothetical protein GWI33_005184 [Rhynchophorus ferrugineus]